MPCVKRYNFCFVLRLKKILLKRCKFWRRLKIYICIWLVNMDFISKNASGSVVFDKGCCWLEIFKDDDDDDDDVIWPRFCHLSLSASLLRLLQIHVWRQAMYNFIFLSSILVSSSEKKINDWLGSWCSV